MPELNIAHEDTVASGIADEVSTVLGFVELALGWYEDGRDSALGMDEMNGLSLILNACVDTLRRIR